MSAIAKKMLQGLTQGFEYVRDPSAVKFDPLFVTATFLNPPYREILIATQTKTAKQYLLELCKPPEPDANLQDNDCTYVPEAESNLQGSTPPSKRPKLLSRVAKLIEEKKKQSNNSVSISAEEEEVDRYSMDCFNIELEDDPFDFWNITKDYPPIACDILCVPSSTAPIERVFSTSGESTSGKCNRLTDYNLEREALLQKNKKYLIEI